MYLGSMIRQEIEMNTELGKVAKEYVDRGDIVPDEIAIKLIEEKNLMSILMQRIYFKGFPLTIAQAYILDGVLRKLGVK